MSKSKQMYMEEVQLHQSEDDMLANQVKEEDYLFELFASLNPSTNQVETGRRKNGEKRESYEL